MTLVAFLLARLAEDEAWARAADTAPWHYEPLPAWERFLDRWQPDTVLAEVAAKRRIVEHHGPHRGDDEFPLCAICTEVGPEAQDWPCLTLRLLALPYADHPDYRQEWKP